MRQERRINKIHGVAFCLVIVMSCGAILLGCSESAKTPSTPVTITHKPAQKPVTQTTGTAVEAPPPPPEYSYNPQGRRDPFAPIVVSAERKAQGSNRSPLERYDLNEFKLTGIVWGGFGYNAMIEGPDGKGYFVRVGTIIGPNKGIIKKITQNKMVVEEKFKTFSGVTERKEIVIELRKKQEGMQ